MKQGIPVGPSRTPPPNGFDAFPSEKLASGEWW